MHILPEIVKAKLHATEFLSKLPFQKKVSLHSSRKRPLLGRIVNIVKLCRIGR